MSIFALSDLHLSIAVPEKKMDIFGENWVNYQEKMSDNWRSSVKPEDLVLVAGDISWASSPDEARIDLEWIDRLPGTKLLLKGNHDYWWSSLTKVKKVLPASCHLLQNDVFCFGDIAIAGTRLWECEEYSFSDGGDLSEPSLNEEERERDRAIFQRELLRLEMSLKLLPKEARVKIAMTHYPPIGPMLEPSSASKLFEKYGVSLVIFGHLHGLIPEKALFGEARGIRYVLTSSDYLNFVPLKIVS